MFPNKLIAFKTNRPPLYKVGDLYTTNKEYNKNFEIRKLLITPYKSPISSLQSSSFPYPAFNISSVT